MTAHLDVVRAWRDDATAQLSAPELDNRGRKRHRSLTRCNAAAKCGTSGESSTLRGRPRRRSTSPYGAASRTTSRGAMDGSASPARKRLLRVVVLDRRRSQSPSRSRSPNRRQQNAARRRQRTRSRSRSHDEKSYRSVEQGGWLRQDVLRKQQAAQKPVQGNGHGLGHGHGHGHGHGFGRGG
ncbi:hypothetical protein VDGD_08985 [Verticillium dahliae]|nr:hypothetical protein VdG1_04761 [Verticillium dahliae VDG1]RBQ81502.1 hypothetical protein VDGD_08985 [Verticillium dahliae]